MITKNDIEKLTAEVAEKSVRTIAGSNIKVQYGRVATTASTTGSDLVITFPTEFDDDDVVVIVTAERPDTASGWYARVKTRSKTGFTCVKWGASATAYSIYVHWIAIGTKTP